MRFRTLALVVFLLSNSLFGQQNNPVAPPDKAQLVELARTLSHPGLQGREPGTAGGKAAADFIESHMRLSGLLPAGDVMEQADGSIERGFFQQFDIIRTQTAHAQLQLFDPQIKAKDTFSMGWKTHFDLLPLQNSFQTTSELVFAGYGAISSDSSYNDFAHLQCQNKIVVVMLGFPGQADTASIAWQKIGRQLQTDGFNIKRQRLNAKNYGASALLVFDTKTTALPDSIALQRLMYQLTGNDMVGYPDPDYWLASDTTTPFIPLLVGNTAAAQAMEAFIGIDFQHIQQKISSTGKPFKVNLEYKKATLAVNVDSDTIVGQNVLALLKGADSSRMLVVGGHFDHLGIRGDSIYTGADDNASGASGAMALAHQWAKSGLLPAQNMLFACWDGEEKGLLGSSFFVQQLAQPDQQINLYLNMDMISRSAEEDVLKNILSIGMRRSDTALKNRTVKMNQAQPSPFNLDLWEVDGHSGSDYGPFVQAGVPVMSFFSGFHHDYHSPRDTFDKMDFHKMKAVLQLVNDCLWSFEE